LTHQKGGNAEPSHKKFKKKIIPLPLYVQKFLKLMSLVKWSCNDYSEVHLLTTLLLYNYSDFHHSKRKSSSKYQK